MQRERAASMSLLFHLIPFALALSLLSPVHTKAQSFHGAFADKTSVGPDGTARAHVGETVTTSIVVINMDDFQDTVTVSNILETVQHGGDHGTSTNLLAAPVNLTGPSVFDTHSLTITYRYPVLPEDAALPDAILQDYIRVDFTDNHDGLGATHVPQDFSRLVGGQIRVLQPCLQVTNECVRGLTEDGLARYIGRVSNSGNTLLTNIVVSNFVNGAFSYVLGPTNLDTNQIISFTNSYTAADPCQPPTNILWAWGTDGLGLTVSNSINFICAASTNSPTLTCQPNMVVECGATWDFTAPTATDACDGTNVPVVILSTTTNQIGHCGKSFSATRIWMATDSALNASTCAQTVIVVDTTPPDLHCPGDQIINCSTAWSFATPTAIDACEGTNLAIVAISTVTNISGPDGNAFAATRTWEAADSCGNLAICSQTFSLPASALQDSLFRPQLDLAQMLPGGGCQFRLTAAPCQFYDIQTSSNLLDWASVTNLLVLTGQTQFHDPATNNAGPRFYRVVR